MNSLTKPHEQPEVRRAQRILRMVAELHKQNYQLLRIFPYMSPSGCHWRCTITFRDNLFDWDGSWAIPNENDVFVARYTSGQDNHYFDWPDAQHDDARKLATKFVERFPTLVEFGQGRDWAYAGWYVELLGLAERGCMPFAFSDGHQPRHGYLSLMKMSDEEDRLLPLPPRSMDSLPHRNLTG